MYIIPILIHKSRINLYGCVSVRSYHGRNLPDARYSSYHSWCVSLISDAWHISIRCSVFIVPAIACMPAGWRRNWLLHLPLYGSSPRHLQQKVRACAYTREWFPIHSEAHLQHWSFSSIHSLFVHHTLLNYDRYSHSLLLLIIVGRTWSRDFYSDLILAFLEAFLTVSGPSTYYIDIWFTDQFP